MQTYVPGKHNYDVRLRYVTAAMAILALPLLLGAGGGAARVEDLGGYWCGAVLNRTGGNPYDHEAVLALERTIEPQRQTPQMPWGPPWSLALVTPLTWFDFCTARYIWLVVQTVALALAAAAVWHTYGGRSDGVSLAWLLLFSHYPTLVLLGLGQVSVANFLALAGILYFLHRQADFRAGLAASLIAAKPQVMLLFALAVLVWILAHRRWRVAAGGVVGLAALTAVVVIPNPQVFAMYLDAMAHRGPTGFIPPTPGTLLRVLAGGALWPSLVPLAAGVVWLTWRMSSRWRDWDWNRELPGLTFACFFASPYAWAYDLTILLIPLLQAAVLADGFGNRRRFQLVASCLAISGLALAMNLCGRQEFEFAWLAPALLVVYLRFVRAQAATQPTQTSSAQRWLLSPTPDS